MIVGYARVSSTGQHLDGNSLEVQERALRAAGAKRVYSDTCTGTKKSRPEFDKLLGILKEGDTLLVTKLDRFARSLRHGLDIIEDLIVRGVRVNILNLGVMDNSPSSKMTRALFFAFAEFERDMILERTQEGKAYAVATNPDYREGRPPADREMFGELYALVLSGELRREDVMTQMGIRRATYYKLAKELQTA